MKKLLTLIIAIMLISSTVSAQDVFTDVPASDWAAPYIYELYNRGIVGGYGDGTFLPQNNVERCEYAKMLVNIAGIEIVNSAVSPYVDVPSYEWYFPYVNSSLSVITGYTSGGDLYFLPTNHASREDVTVALVKALGINIYNYKNPDEYLQAKFTDFNEISTHNRAYIMAAVDEGIITGDEDGTFRPHDPIIRAEVVAVLCRAFPK